MRCRLCGSSDTDLWKAADKKYLFCRRCGFVQVLRKYFPSPDKERERYLKHDNSISNPGYVKFLESFIDSAVMPYIERGSDILDFGSGPSPVLSELLNRRGYRTVSYDPYFSDINFWKERTFRGVVSLEVFEHMHNPVRELESITAVIERGGYLAIGTVLHHEDRTFFDKWWYKDDFTHVSFYSEKTFRFIAEIFGLKFITQKDGTRIILLKPS